MDRLAPRHGDIVQIVDPAHHWYPALIVVDEVREWGVQGYTVIPTNDPTPNGLAYIRLNKGVYALVGSANIVKGVAPVVPPSTAAQGTDRVYLGDSVYADRDSNMLRLTTENGYGPTNTIWLECEVFLALMLYGQKTWELRDIPDAAE